MTISTLANTDRSPVLRQLMVDQPLCRILEVHSPMAAIVAEHACSASGRTFDGFWSSSLTDSAVRGLPDTELVSLQHRLEWIDQIFAVTTKPLVMDGDTGGLAAHFSHLVPAMERHGVSAVVIEDKAGEKQNSLLDDAAVHVLADTDAFAAKIAAGKAAQLSDSFMIVARLEGLIVGLEDRQVLARAAAYVEAGADALVVHSRQRDGVEVLRLAAALSRQHPDVPLVAIPTTYPTVSESDLAEAGFNLVIYANHMLRASALAMDEVSRRILDDGRSSGADGACLDVQRLLSMHADTRPLVRT